MQEQKTKIVVDSDRPVIDYFTIYGIVCSETDGSIYYNNDKWLKKDKDGIVWEVDFNDLPDSVKAIHLEYINKPTGQEARTEAIAFWKFCVKNNYKLTLAANEIYELYLESKKEQPLN